MKCSSTGRKCDGYVEPPPRKRRSPGPLVPREIQSPYPQNAILLYAPSIDIQGDFQERRSFHYFRSRNMSQLPGNFEPYFWDRMVLQFSHHDTVIRHSLVALSAIYEERELTTQAPNQIEPCGAYPSMQYMRAVKQLTEAISSPRVDVRIVLVSCLIFVWIDLLRDNFLSAFKHLECGLKILDDIASTTGRTINSDFEDITGSLTRSFMRLGAQASLHGNGSATSPSSFPKMLGIHTEIPRSFSSVFESRNYFDNEINAVFGKIRQVRINTRSDPDSGIILIKKISQFHMERLQLWRAANDQLVKSIPLIDLSLDKRQAFGTIYLQLYYLVLMTVLPWVESEMAFDNMYESFEKIISLSECLLESSDKTSPYVLSFDMGVISPLFTTILKCRDTRLRRRAISLLEKAPEQEGLWNRDNVLRFSKWKVAFEEKNRGDLPETSVLPEYARIYGEHSLIKLVDGKRVQIIRFYRSTGEQVDLPTPAELADLTGMGDMI
jgi:hypothetical protein